MTTARARSGVTESTVTTGTGTYTLAGAVAPWKEFISGDDGLTYHYGVYSSDGFECGLGTYTHSTRELARTQILSNHLGTTSPVDWGGGTKQISMVAPAERVAATDILNEFTEDQDFGGNKLYLDADGDTWIVASTDDVIEMYSNSIQKFKLTGGIGALRVYGDDDGADEGPEIVVERRSNSPAVNDALGVFRQQFKDAGGTTVTSFKIRSVATAVTADAASTKASFDILNTGTLQSIVELRSDAMIAQSDVYLRTCGKTTSSFSTVGTELSPDGEVIAVASGTAAVQAYRSGASGRIIEVGVSGSATGGIISTAGTVAIDPFTGMHWADWAPGAGGAEFEAFGTVVSTAEGDLGIPNEPAVLVRPAVGPDDRRVYGVVAERIVVRIGTEDRDLLGIFAVGNGYIKVKGEVSGGDLLRASSTPGVAERAPVDEPLTIGGMACIVAKATQNSPDDGGVRLVSCVYMGG